MAADWRSTFRGIPDRLRTTLPAEMRVFGWSATSWMAKAWFGNRALHYEIWVRYHARVVEVGLHFEADALTNARLLAAFRARSREVKRGLGGDARIEDWDKGWTRVWEPIAFAMPDIEDHVAARFCDYVRVLEPILRDEVPGDVEWVLERPRALRAGLGRQKARTRSAAKRRSTSSRASR